MINKILPLLFFSILLYSCSSTINEPVSVSIDQSVIPECATAACPEVSVLYIEYKDSPKKVQAINDSINSFIISALNLGDPTESPTASNPKEAIQNFIKDYWRDTSEFPEINEYEAEVMVTENFRSDELLSISLSQYSYTGGAHGNGMLAYKNVDIKTGEVLTRDQLIHDLKGLTSLAEKKLREEHKIPKNESINATLFWFENETFQLSQAIGIENDSLIIHYNQYEIASYADGPIAITLALEEVAPFLNYSLK